MKKTILLLWITLIFTCLNGFSQGILPDENVSLIQKRVTRAADLMATFRKSHSAADLEITIRAARAVPIPALGDMTKWRLQMANIWFGLVKGMDELQDDNDKLESPENIVFLNLVPPSDLDGVTYPSGIDPRAIKDEKARGQYEADLKANQQKADRLLELSKLHYLKLQLTNELKMFVRMNYRDSEEDQQELKKRIESANLSVSGKAELISILKTK